MRAGWGWAPPPAPSLFALPKNDPRPGTTGRLCPTWRGGFRAGALLMEHGDTDRAGAVGPVHHPRLPRPGRRGRPVNRVRVEGGAGGPAGRRRPVGLRGAVGPVRPAGPTRPRPRAG